MELIEMYEMSLETWKGYLNESKKTKEVEIEGYCHFCDEVNNKCDPCRCNIKICALIWGNMNKAQILLVIKLIEKEIEKLKEE